MINEFKRTYGHTYIAWINKIGAEGCCSVNSNMKCEQQQQGRQVHDWFEADVIVFKKRTRSSINFNQITNDLM